MDKKICLDTNMCVELIKENETIKSKLLPYAPFRSFISSVTVFELFLRKTNLEKVEEFISINEVLPVDTVTAKKASEIYKDCSGSGYMVDLRDIFIASTAIANNCTLATLNKKHFERIKELKILDF